MPPAEKETSSTETTTQITASSSPAVATESVSDNNGNMFMYTELDVLTIQSDQSIITVHHLNRL